MTAIKQKRYFKEWETELPEDEFKKRKKEFFMGRLFYKRLCNLVTRIHDFHGTEEGPVSRQQRAVKLQEQIEIKRENDKKQLHRIVKRYAQTGGKQGAGRDRSYSVS